MDRCHAGGLRRHLPLRHRRLGVDPGDARAEAPAGRPRRPNASSWRRSMGASEAEPGVDLDLSRVSSCGPIGSSTAGSSAGRCEEFESGSFAETARVFIERIRRGRQDRSTPTPTTVLRKDDDRRSWSAAAKSCWRPCRRRSASRWTIAELLDFPAADPRRGGDQQSPRREDAAASSREADQAARSRAGVYLRKLIRARPGDAVHAGYQASTAATCCSSSGPSATSSASPQSIGYADRVTETDRHGRHGHGHRVGALIGALTHQCRRGAAQPEHQRRRAHRRAGLRLAALGQPRPSGASRRRRCGCSTTSA